MSNNKHHLKACTDAETHLEQAVFKLKVAKELLKNGTIDDETYRILKLSIKNVVDIKDQVNRYKSHYENAVHFKPDYRIIICPSSDEERMFEELCTDLDDFDELLEAITQNDNIVHASVVSFNTKKELNLFLEGYNAGVGYLGNGQYITKAEMHSSDDKPLYKVYADGHLRAETYSSTKADEVKSDYADKGYTTKIVTV